MTDMAPIIVVGLVITMIGMFLLGRSDQREANRREEERDND